MTVLYEAPVAALPADHMQCVAAVCMDLIGRVPDGIVIAEWRLRPEGVHAQRSRKPDSDVVARRQIREIAQALGLQYIEVDIGRYVQVEARGVWHGVPVLFWDHVEVAS